MINNTLAAIDALPDGCVYVTDGDSNAVTDITAADLKILRAEYCKCVKALREITEGKGRFSRDPLTHAANTIDDMKELAQKALGFSETIED